VDPVIFLLPVQLRVLWNFSVVDFISLFKISIFRILDFVEEFIVIFSKSIMSESENLREDSSLVEEMGGCEFLNHDVVKSVNPQEDTDGVRVKLFTFFSKERLCVKSIMKCHRQQIHVRVDSTTMLSTHSVD